MQLPDTLKKILGWLLLFTTIGGVSCQSMYHARLHNAPQLPLTKR